MSGSLKEENIILQFIKRQKCDTLISGLVIACEPRETFVQPVPSSCTSWLHIPDNYKIEKNIKTKNVRTSSCPAAWLARVSLEFHEVSSLK